MSSDTVGPAPGSPAGPASSAAGQRTADLDLRGRAAIRVIDAGPAEMRALRSQVGLLPELGRPTGAAASGDATGRGPDVTISFVDRLDLRGRTRLIGPDALASDDAYVALRGRRQRRVRVELPVDRLGTGPAEIVAERGVGAIPLLLPILGASLLARGVIPVHASAFAIDGRGVLVSGWAKGGKSETLLAFMTNGARYIGDEWIYLDPDGPRMFGLPEPIRLWDWQLAMVPAVGRRVRPWPRLRLAAAGGFAGGLGVAGAAPGLRRTAAGEAARRMGAVVDRQRSLQLPVADIFGPDAIELGPAAIDRLLLVESADEDTVTDGVDVALAARRIAATTAHELLDLEAARLAWSFAFPDRPAAGLVGLEERIRAGLERILVGVPIRLVRHRYPPNIPALHDLIAANL